MKTRARLWANNGGGGGTPWLYRYQPGASLARATFTRADAATCATQLDVNGIYQTVAANVARAGHYVAGVRTLLLEAARTENALRSADLSNNAAWQWSGSLTEVAATSCINAQTAQQMTDIGGGSNHVSQTLGTFVTAQTDLVWAIVELPVTNPATITDLGIRDLTGTAWVTLARFTWASHTIAITTGSGACGALSLGNGRYLLWVTGSGTNGNSRAVFLYPCGVPSNTTACIVHGAGLLPNRTSITTPIVTAGATVTQAVDALSLAGLVAPNPSTLYYRYVDLSTMATTDVAASYTSGAAIVPPTGRAYTDLVVFPLTRTAAQCRALLGY